MSVLNVMDRTGIAPIEWTPEDDKAVEEAQAAFTAAKAKGYLAYRSAPDASGEVVNELIREFDASAPEITMTPQTQGG